MEPLHLITQSGRPKKFLNLGRVIRVDPPRQLRGIGRTRGSDGGFKRNPIMNTAVSRLHKVTCFRERRRERLTVPNNAVYTKEVILVDLPSPCRRGREGGSKKRQRWLKRKLNSLQIDRGLQIVGHRIVGDTLHVTCFQLAAAMDPQTFPSEMASTSSVILPPGRASPSPRARVQEHEAMSNANGWTDTSGSPGPSGSTHLLPMATVQSPSLISEPVSTVANLSSMPPYVCDIPVRCLEVGNPRNLSTPWILLFFLSLRNIGYYGKQPCNAASRKSSSVGRQLKTYRTITHNFSFHLCIRTLQS